MIQNTARWLSPLSETSTAARQLIVSIIGLGIVLYSTTPARANDPQGPWECSGYSGEAHTRCLAAFVQAQREQIASLQGKVQAQQETVDQMKAQMNRQALANATSQSQVAPSPIIQAAPPLYGYPPVYGYPLVYGYPPVGIGVYIGRPWFYGPPYFYRPYFYGPRYFGYRHWSHR